MLVRLFLQSVLIILFLSYDIISQIVTQEYATGLTNPMGLTIDDAGNLWVAEGGTSVNDSKISIVTNSGIVYPFMINLPSGFYHEGSVGAEHVIFDIDGKLLIVQGEGGNQRSESILVVDTSGFTPGDPPLTPLDIEVKYNIGDYSISQGASSSNPYRIVLGPNNDWYIVDAGFNGVIKRERNTGTLSVFTHLGNVVTTGIVYTGSEFFLGSLSGFPIPTGVAKVYEVDLSGNYSIYHGGLTAIMDIAINPLDGKLFAIQYAEFDVTVGWGDNTGALFVVTSTSVDTLIYGLNYPAGMVFNSAGELFITNHVDGIITKVIGIPVGVEDEVNSFPENYLLMQNYPNPFNPSTKIKYQIAEAGFVSLKVYDVLGNEVATLVNEEKEPGSHTVQFNTSSIKHFPSSGIYFYKLQTGSFVETKKMILLK
jgi:hypothetical protein